MAKSELIIVTGIAIGEESKGGTVEFLAHEFGAHTVWRSGGCQSGHHIETPDGRSHAFTHFGAGTFEGARTFIKHMVISPIDLFKEAMELEEKGVKNPLDLITISSDCLTTTPYHSNMSRLREILRGSDKKGTVGKGVGEAIIDSKLRPDLEIRAGDFKKTEAALKEMLENVRQYKLSQAEGICASHIGPLPEEAVFELNNLRNEQTGIETAEAFHYLSELVQIAGDSYLNSLLKSTGLIINESDHGVLHHPRMGFLPHITQVDPTSADVINTLEEHQYKGEVRRIGVLRCYMSRFGAGPLPSYSAEMTASMSDKNNADNPWLGPFRVGAFDPIALRYAIQICGGQSAFSGLMLSHLDHLSNAKKWPICESYEFIGKADDLNNFFEIQHGLIVGIKLYPDNQDEKQRQHQLRLTELLKNCRPIISDIAAAKPLSLEQTFLDYVEKKLEVPIVALSHGPTRNDKQILPNGNVLFGR